MRSLTSTEYDQALREIKAYGYTKLPKLLSDSEVKYAKDLVIKHHALSDGIRYNGTPARDASDKILYNLPNKEKWFIDLLRQADLRRLLMTKLNDPHYRFLPGDVPNYYLSYFNARSGGDELALHIDSHVPSPGDLTWSMQVAFILDPSSIENGCTKVVPGSHLSGTFTDRDLTRFDPICADPGDVVLWDSRLWHGTYANVAKTSRWSLIATLVMWWVKPSMDFTKSLPQNIYDDLDNEGRALLGFCAIPPSDERHRINTKSGYDVFEQPRTRV